MLIYSTSSYIILKKSPELFHIPKSKNSIILGHSHAACGLNDSIIDSTINLASGAEAYAYTYQKAKALLQFNPHIERVYLEFSNNQITERMNDWTFKEPEGIWNFPKVGFAMELSDLENFISYPRFLLKSLHLSFRKNIEHIIRANNFIDSKFWGKYVKNKLKLNPQLLKDSGTKASDLGRISEINLHYLRKIIQLCRVHGVTINLVRSPVHKDYYFLKNENLFQEVLEEFEDIKFLDFQGMTISNEDFADLQHLNYSGSIKYSSQFNKIISEDK